MVVCDDKPSNIFPTVFANSSEFILLIIIPQRTEILMMSGSGDRVGSWNTTGSMFYLTPNYPERSISQSTASKTERKFRVTSSVNNLSDRPASSIC